MTAILAFLTTNPWRAIALGLGLLLALGFIRLEFAKASAERAEAKLALCAVNVGTLKTALEAQNEAVRGFQAEALERDRKAKEEAERRKKENDDRRRREAADTRSGPGHMTAFFERVF